MVAPNLPVEIAVQDVAGVRIALEAGAARVELCQALALGGLTPSAGPI
ncbi:copper homeostasis protein CutC [Agromyces bauzanensis]|nr:copper homeostasis protein CutC [Agromyces bauzanensis]